jgi:hypothetical protein
MPTPTTQTVTPTTIPAPGNSGEPSRYDQITIQGQTFKVPIRYSAGHALTEGEASALNQTYHENLRNNFANKVRDGVEAGLSTAILQQQLDDYAQEYQFGQRVGGGGFRGDPVMTLAMNIARDMVRTAIKAKQLDAEEWPASRVSQAAKALLDSQGEDGKIVSAARKQVETERAVAQENMATINEMLDASAAQTTQ